MSREPAIPLHRQHPGASSRRGARAASRSALTLAELLVVLMILAVVATVAVQSMAPVVEQARFEATQRTLTQIRAGIVGSDSATTGADPVTGFVADVGRLPVSLDELLVPPVDALPFALQSAPAPFADVVIPRGWRGPYVRLPVGSAALLDGWGMPLAFDAVSNPGTLTIASLAATRIAASVNYQTDLGFSLPPAAWQATSITGSLYRLNASDNNRRIPPSAAAWAMVLFAPGAVGINDGVALVEAQNPPTVSGSVTVAATGEVSYTFSAGLSIGPRALRATRNGQPVGQTVYLTLHPGAVHHVDLLVE